MHELSLCRAIVGIVDRARQDRAVAAVHVQVGQLRQVVPQTLADCWRLVTDGTELAGARLVVDHVPIVLQCQDCRQHTTVGELLRLSCAACGSSRVRLVSGEEMLVTTLDLAPPGQPVAAGDQDGKG